jgi:hypothetical protein
MSANMATKPSLARGLQIRVKVFYLRIGPKITLGLARSNWYVQERSDQMLGSAGTPG